ncbi:MAG TPA: hypothetical protein VL123_03895 [Candidatus Udaeobacter sp.]|nr:hypothetical protein [Candidatus Udaeobacter sp.]
MPDSSHPSILDITLALSRLADRVSDSDTPVVEPYVTFTLRRALAELELHIPGLDPPPDPDSAEHFRQSAEHALEDGDDREALSRALRGLACAPHDPQLFYLAASACFEMGAVEDALRLLYHTLWIHPGHRLARTDLEALTAFLDGSEDGEKAA